MASAVSLNSSPIVLGNDGTWITYSIQVGTPPQTFNVIPSTVLSDTWTISPSVCSQASGNAQANCAAFRGSLFDPRSSSTWEYVFDNSGTAFSLGVEASYGWNQNNTGFFGHDTLVLQSEKGAVPVLGTIIGSMNTNATATGLLGLASKPVSFQNGGQTSSTNSTLQTLRDAGTIPSMSYSYSAGAFYNKTTGLLILGGYDSASYVQNNVPFTFASDPNNVLSVGLLSITSMADGKTTPLSDGAVQALIDSTVSELWLPESWCDKFATAFNLTYNPTNQLYLLDADAIAANDKANPVVTIEIANTQVANAGNTVSIQFPWNAFNNTFTDLNSPAYSKPYFSIRKTTGQYTLGRTFLQEAVITVDHERRNFSVAQVVDLSNTTPNIVNIPSISSASTSGSGSGGSGSTTATPVPSPSGGGGISGGAIGGIVVAVVVLAAAAIAGFWFWKRRRSQYSSPEDAKIDGPPRLPPEAFNEKSGAAEMATPPPKNHADPLVDYHASQRQNIKAAMAMSHSRSELDGDTFNGERAQSPLPAYVPAAASRAHPNQPAELPSERVASELHSGPASPTSSPPFSPPVSDMVPSPGSEGPLASAADMGWGTSPTEAQSNHPAGYMITRGANSRDLRGSPGVNSNRGSDVPAMAATSGPLGVGLGIDREVSESLRRQDSTKSKNSTADLVSPLGSINAPHTSVSNALSPNIPRKSTRE